MPQACIVVIGNEILEGSTTDTNSGWVCRQLSGRGATVSSTLVLPDDKESIVDGLAFLVKKQPNLIITLGGLGPTRDDLTLEAVAQFLGVETELNADALSIVRRRYAELAAEGRISEPNSREATAAREKMAMIPVGALPLDNIVGAAPAVWIEQDEMVILSLPGVPREMKSIFTNFCGSVLQQTVGAGYFATLTLVLDSNDESSLAAPLSAFDSKHSDLDIYLKSRARRFDSEERMTVTLSAKGNDFEEVEGRLAKARAGFIDLTNEVDIGLIDERRGE